MRLFFAVEIPDEAKALLSEAQKALQEKLRGAKVRWTIPEKWHATLVFLGEIPDSQLEQVIEAGKRAAQGAEPFDLKVSGLGVFGKSPRYGMAMWAGLSCEGPGLEKLVAELNSSMALSISRKADTSFVPHVTLGRVREASPEALEVIRSVGQACMIQDSMPWQCSAFTLYQSELGSSATPYEAKQYFSL